MSIRIFAVGKLLACCLLLVYSCNNSTPSLATSSMAGLTVLNTGHDRNVERGKYLAWHVTGCIDCHSTRDFSKFSAPVVPGTEGKGGERFGPEYGLPGNIFAKNITPAALRNWTDEEIIRSITTGVSKSGDTLFPIMPYLAFSAMEKQDLLDIVAYIRTLKPIENEVPKRELFIPIAAAIPPALPSPDLDKNVRPSPKDKVKYGEYLVRMASCSDCHTPMVKGAPDFTRYLAGGSTFTTPQFTVTTPNITPDETGIGLWTEKMFIQKFRDNSSDDYVNRQPGKFNSIMPWSLYGKMKEEDLSAIYAYLRTVKPAKGRITPWAG